MSTRAMTRFGAEVNTSTSNPGLPVVTAEPSACAEL